MRKLDELKPGIYSCKFVTLRVNLGPGIAVYYALITDNNDPNSLWPEFARRQSDFGLDFEAIVGRM